MPAKPLLQSELGDQVLDRVVSPKEVVVELLEPHSGLDLEARREAAGPIACLEHGDGVAALCQLMSCREPENAPTKDPIVKRPVRVRLILRRPPDTSSDRGIGRARVKARRPLVGDNQET